MRYSTTVVYVRGLECFDSSGLLCMEGSRVLAINSIRYLVCYALPEAPFHHSTLWRADGLPKWPAGCTPTCSVGTYIYLFIVVIQSSYPAHFNQKNNLSCSWRKDKSLAALYFSPRFTQPLSRSVGWWKSIQRDTS